MVDDSSAEPPTNLSPHDRSQHRLDAVVLGPGDGGWFVAKSQEGLHNVRHVVPGDRIRIALRPDDPPWADLLTVLVPSPDRIESHCRYAGRCGGCHWLGMSDVQQREMRKRILRDRLEAIGCENESLVMEVLPSPSSTAYRYRARFQLSPHAHGFHRPAERRTIDIPRCPLLAPPLQQAWSHLRRSLENLAMRAENGSVLDAYTGAEITALPGASGALLYINPRDKPPAQWQHLAERLLGATNEVFAGVAVRESPSTSNLNLLGKTAIEGHTPAGRPIAAAARGFVQSHLAGADLLVDTVIDFAGRGGRCLEFYSGSGLIGHSLARRGWRVRAVESHALSARASAALARKRPETGGFEVTHSEALPFFDALDHPEQADLLVADPPRGGLEELAQRIAARGPRRVILIHCSLRGLERDLPVLLRAGYRLERSVLLDLFPYTRFLEHIALLHRDAPSPR